MQSFRTFKAQPQIPFYLEDNPLASSKRGIDTKKSIREPPQPNPKIVQAKPQKNSKEKPIEFERLLSAIEPVEDHGEMRSNQSEGWDALFNSENDRLSEANKGTTKKWQESGPQPQNKSLRKISREIISNQILDIKAFINAPLERDRMLKCTLHRDRSGFKTFFPEFSLRMGREQKLLLFAKKQAGNRTSNYRISVTKQGIDSKGPDYVGKVRSNFFGTGYSVYDNGDNPKQHSKTARPRRLLVQVHYQNKFMMCNLGPKKMEAYIPSPGIETQGEADLRQLHNHNPSNIISMANKLPQWNEKMGAYLLDLEGRADKPSIKNFILVDEDSEDMMMLLGKVDDDNFNIDICHPLSVLQAFGIVLSAFDFKLASQ